MKQSGHIPSLNGLRGIAVLLVVLAHAHRTSGFPDLSYIKAIGSVGHVGVDVFFVISGFLITTLLMREQDKSGKVRIGAFYRRRILRIVPAYVAFLLAVTGLQLAGHAQLTMTDWLAAATYTVNFLPHPAWEIGHAWSLSIEEHFYLAWPLIFATSRRAAFWIAAACLVVCPAIRWYVLLYAPHLSPMTDLWTFTRLDGIAAGCLLALSADRLKPPGMFAVLSAFAALVVAMGLSRVSGKFAAGIAPSMVAGTIAILLWGAVNRPPAFLNWKPLEAIGVVSYSLYLWQQLFLNPHQSGVLCSFPLNVALAVVAAFLSYRFIEQPFLSLKERFG